MDNPKSDKIRKILKLEQIEKEMDFYAETFQISHKTLDAMWNRILSIKIGLGVIDNVFYKELLFFAARDGNAEMMKFIVKNHFDNEFKNLQIVMNTAIEFNRLNLIKELIALGADIELKDMQGNNALHRASAYSHEILKYLLENCPINDLDSKNDNGKTPLLYAAQYGNLENIKILIDYGADINAVSNSGETILHESLRDVRTFTQDIANKNLEFLIKNHFSHNVDIKDENDITPLQIALMTQNLQAIQMLVSCGADIGADIYCANKEYENALEFTIYENLTKSGKFLLKNFKFSQKEIEQALNIAVRSGCFDIAECLLKNFHFSQNQIDKLFVKSLNELQCPWAFDSYRLDSARLLFVYGADLAKFKNMKELLFNPACEIKDFIKDISFIDLELSGKQPYHFHMEYLVRTEETPDSQMEQLKKNETYVILKKIFGNAGLQQRLAEKLKLQNPENAMPISDPQKKIVMKGAEQNQGIKQDFKILFQNYKNAINDADHTFEDIVIYRMLNIFKNKHQYEPIAEFRTRQTILFQPGKRHLTTHISNQIAANETEKLFNKIKQNLECKIPQNVDLELLIAAALFRPKMVKSDLERDLPKARASEISI